MYEFGNTLGRDAFIILCFGCRYLHLDVCHLGFFSAFVCVNLCTFVIMFGFS